MSVPPQASGGKPRVVSLGVKHADADRMLDALVRAMCEPGTSWNRARDLVRRGKVRVNGLITTEVTRRIPQGSEITLDIHARSMREHELSSDALLYVDADVVVVSKPAGLMTVPYEDEENTLVDRVKLALRQPAPSRSSRREGAPQPRKQQTELGVVQRLDKDTTGVLVFARNLESKRNLQQQFRAHTIERRYLAIVHGELRAATYESDLIRDRGDGLKGSFAHFRRPKGPLPSDAQHAITHVRPLEALRGATLVECRLETGRQHQIRIHVSEHGHPIVGEQVYIRDFLGTRIAANRPMLHAAVLGFVHPRTAEPMEFKLDPPADFVQKLGKLR